eukprot:845315_1
MADLLDYKTGAGAMFMAFLALLSLLFVYIAVANSGGSTGGGLGSELTIHSALPSGGQPSDAIALAQKNVRQQSNRASTVDEELPTTNSATTSKSADDLHSSAAKSATDSKKCK